MTPLPGLVLIRRPVTAQTLPGGHIQLLPATVESWTQGQAEVVAVGPPALPDDPEDYDGALDEAGCIPLDPRLVPGAWVVTRFRNWVQSERADEYLVRHEDVLAILETP